MNNLLNLVLYKAAGAFKKIKNQPKPLILASLCDILFFVAYGFITAPLLRKLVDYVIIIGSMVSEQAASIMRGTNPSIVSIIMDDPQIRQFFNKLILIYLILAVAIYIVYTFFHATAWKLSSDIAGRKNSMYNFMKEFALLNLFWVVLFIVYHFLSLFADLRQSAMQSLKIGASNSFSIAVTILLFVIVYFAFISYTLIGKHSTKQKIKKGFYLGIKKIKYILPAYVVIAAVYFVIKYLLEAAARVNFNLMIFVGLFTVIPAITWARVYLMLIVEKAEKAE